jgi:DNA-binding IscR family transcriptional regulator
MSLAITPKDFILRAMRDFRQKHPDSPFMPLALLAEQMKITEDQLQPIMEQLHEFGLVDLHPMWPHLREAYISEGV